MLLLPWRLQFGFELMKALENVMEGTHSFCLSIYNHKKIKGPMRNLALDQLINQLRCPLLDSFFSFLVCSNK